MNCSSFDHVAERYFDGELRTEERADFAKHLDGCDACAALFEELRVVDALLLEPRRVEPVSNFTFAVMAEVRSLPGPAKRDVRFVSWLAGYVAVSWLLVAAAFAFAGPDVRAVLAEMIRFGAQTGLGVASVAQGTFHGGAGGGAFGAVVIAGSALFLDAVFAVAIVAVVLFVHPRLVARFAAASEGRSCDAS